MNVNTVQIIYELQGTRMHPGEWQAIKEVLQDNESAWTDLACLAR
jgi:hypothetical protein